MKLLNIIGATALGLSLATGAHATTLTYQIGDEDCHGFGATSCNDGDTFANPGVFMDNDLADLGNSTDHLHRPAHSLTNDPTAGLFFDFNIDLGGEVATSAKIEFNAYSLDFAFVGSPTLSGSNPEDGAVFFFNGNQHSIHKGLGDSITFREFSLMVDVATILDMDTNTFRIHADGLTSIDDDYSIDFVRLIIETEAAGGGGGGQPTGVPIPAGGLLLASALGLLGWNRRKS